MAEISEELRRQMIAEAAYFRAQRRGFSSGDELEDWLESEREIDARIGARHDGTLQQRLDTVNEHLKAFRKGLAEKSKRARQEREEDLKTLANYRDKLRKWVRKESEQGGAAAANARRKAEETWEEILALLQRLGRRKT